MKALLLVVGVLVLSGCINISTRLQPEDKTVPATLEGSDCVPIVLGFAYGTADIANALGSGHNPGESYGGRMIRKVRFVEMWDVQFLFIGARCVEVVGE